MAPFGPSAVFAENFDFYGRVLTGSTQPRPRWMRAVSVVQTILGDAVGERYVAEYVDPRTVPAVAELVNALVRSYRRRLVRATWMQDSTRAAAVRKLDNMVFEIGSPDSSAGRQDLQVNPTDLLGNIKRGREWYVRRELARLAGPVDPSDWRIHPQQVTAYYRHGLNQVVIPAALLQPPVFALDGDPTRNFAVLGSIVSHEMSHAFDSRGSRHDDRGRVRNWWAPQDRAEFTRRTALLVAHYDRYEPDGLAGHRVSGTRTVAENSADITGLTVAHDAFTATADTVQSRQFFLHWASMWRGKCTPGRMLDRLASDRHAPGNVRCNGALGHVAAFYSAFDVRPGDLLYISPAERFALV
jgi:putative endopeptidase